MVIAGAPSNVAQASACGTRDLTEESGAVRARSGAPVNPVSPETCRENLPTHTASRAPQVWQLLQEHKAVAKLDSVDTAVSFRCGATISSSATEGMVRACSSSSSLQQYAAAARRFTDATAAHARQGGTVGAWRPVCE